jgi:hypothetical protein
MDRGNLFDLTAFALAAGRGPRLRMDASWCNSYTTPSLHKPTVRLGLGAAMLGVLSDHLGPDPVASRATPSVLATTGIGVHLIERPVADELTTPIAKMSDLFAPISNSTTRT